MKTRKFKLIKLENAIKPKLKSSEFRKAYNEELARIQIAHQIRQLRQRRQLTQGQVARRASMPQSVIARVESGRHAFSLATLYRIAAVFDKEVKLV